MKKSASLSVLFFALITFCAAVDPVSAQSSSLLLGKKVLWVDSYHQGYAWSDGIEQGIRTVLADTGVELTTYRMDTKRNSSEEFCYATGKLIADKIELIHPDIVIASDDNAQKCLVVPWLKKTDLPVVFSGINVKAETYCYPCENITGMEEVDHVEKLLALMRQHAKGDRIGYLSTDVATARINADRINTSVFDNQMKVYLVKTFSDFKRQFLKAQNEVDMLIIYNNIGIDGWDDLVAESFLIRNTKIPTGAFLDFIKPFAVYTYSKLSKEQGEYAATVALEILEGKSPADIPVIKNMNSELIVNLKMAKAAGITVPLPVLKTAEIIGRDAYSSNSDKVFTPDAYRGKKVLWVNSYHPEYSWSDGIGQGIQEGFAEAGIEFKAFYMDTKNNQSAEFGQQMALKAMKLIDNFKPDAIIASDDNAQKYLVVPKLLQTEIPVIFCGINHDASMYGYPRDGITGMVEVEPIHALLNLLRSYTQGERVGYLYSDVPTERKIVENYRKIIPEAYFMPYPVSDFTAFKQAIIQAQNEVDMLVIPNSAGIAGWDATAAEELIQTHGTLPTGSFLESMNRYVIFTMANSPEEQGRYSAATVLRLFDGEKPEEIPISTNKTGDITINIKMAEAAGIVIPVATLKQARKVIGQEIFRQQ